MAGPDETSDVQPTGVKRPLLDVESLQRKKFKTEELPLTAAQRTAIEDLLHAFKKKGGFDNVRKKIWAEFHDGEARAEFTKLLIELAESEIEREPELLSRERGKAATLIEGAVDRSDVYKKAEKLIDALASNHLQFILDSVREIRRQQVGDELAAKEEQAGNKTDEDFAAEIRAKREIREREWQETVRKQRELEEQEARRKAEEERKKREIERQKEEEERARRKEREEQRRAERERQREEERRLEEQREKERQERYERRRREERERYRYRSPRYRDSRREKSVTPKEPTQAPPPPPPPPVAVDDKSLEEAALQLLLKEGEELAAKARQKPDFDFEEAEAIENGLKPPPTKPKGATESRYSITPLKSASPSVDMDQRRRRDSTVDDRHRPYRRDGSRERSRSRRRYTPRFDDDRRRERSRDASSRPRDRNPDDRVAIRDFRANRYGDRSYRPNRRTEIEIERESVIGIGTENAKGTGIGIIGVAVTILGLVHELDADDRALSPALEIGTKIGLEMNETDADDRDLPPALEIGLEMNETETENEIESEIVIKNDIETETKNKAGFGKETVKMSEEDPGRAFRIPLEDRLAPDGVPPVLLTSTAMCPQRAIGADPPEGVSDLQIAQSEMIVEAMKDWQYCCPEKDVSGASNGCRLKELSVSH
ncbi:hypothetical protein KXV22_002466 [Aspergillus fumigatus]|nr:hypothetical protein KXX20_000243 [Aspergillus fumigatus]KAH1832694.1 hypothetical protein KXX35_008070 [Aspergillus fumigatus]KAH1884147.1 hypothetical protein KXX08_004019 [Aspergillus fumigatus]KAH1917595.1 hypothetical protein KXW47_001270 [Aspergillus fumigatus]KAH2015855.1 hypothetical protein KXV97_004372 [Aspergillus fumigatus]